VPGLFLGTPTRPERRRRVSRLARGAPVYTEALPAAEPNVPAVALSWARLSHPGRFCGTRLDAPAAASAVVAATFRWAFSEVVARESAAADVGGSAAEGYYSRGAKSIVGNTQGEEWAIRHERELFKETSYSEGVSLPVWTSVPALSKLFAFPLFLRHFSSA